MSRPCQVRTSSPSMGGPGPGLVAVLVRQIALPIPVPGIDAVEHGLQKPAQVDFPPSLGGPGSHSVRGPAPAAPPPAPPKEAVMRLIFTVPRPPHAPKRPVRTGPPAAPPHSPAPPDSAPLHLPEEQAGEGVLPLPLPQGPGRPDAGPAGSGPRTWGESSRSSSPRSSPSIPAPR